MLIVFIILFCISICFNIFLLFFKNKIEILEKKIILLFEKRTHLVPSLYEITKPYLNKHDEIFQEIIKLRKIEFSNYDDAFIKRIYNEKLIHHELNFIFKVSQQNYKLQKNEKFLLIRDLFLENSENIWSQIKIYKYVINTINKLIKFKNLTLIWIFIHISPKNEI